MAKILTGSTISYGSTLPASASIPDGTLFFLTTAYTDPANSPTNPTASSISRVPGLLLFNFQQDSNPLIAGDQVGQIWKQLSTLQVFVDKTGDTMTGPLSIDLGNTNPQLRLISTTPGIRFTETDQAANTREWLVAADGGSLQIQTRSDAFAVQSTVFTINRSGVATINGGTVWHANNDGAGSELDSDLLDGQQGTFYLSSANHTGTVPLSRGGTGTTTTTPGGIVYGTGSALATSVAGSAGQVLVSGGSGAPSWINSSSIGSGSSATAGALSPGATIALSGAATGTATLFTGASAISIPVTALNANNLSAGTVPLARLGSSGTPTTSTFLRGDNTWAAPPVSGGGGGSVTSVGVSITGSGLSVSGSPITSSGTITITSSATNLNTANTIVFRDASGNFSAGTITASTGFSGPGGSITALNASQLTSGTVGTARLGTGTANSSTFLRGDNTWAAPPTGGGGGGSVESVAISGSNGITVVSGSPITTTGTIALSTNATSTNTASAIVSRDGSGNFSAGTITATFSGNGSAITNLAANNLASGQAPVARLGTGTANSTTFLRGDGTWAVPPAGGGGSVTGVGLVMPTSVFAVTNSPVTTIGDLTASFITQTANRIFAGPASGGAAVPTFRALVAADIPTLNQNTTGTAANVTGTVAIANGGTGATSAANARTALGATATGSSVFTAVDAPAARTAIGATATGSSVFTAVDAAAARTAIGAGTGNGTVTSVGGTGTVSGISLSGSVSSSGNLTLGGTLSVVPANFASQSAATFLAAPTASSGTPSFRTITLTDINASSTSLTANTVVSRGTSGAVSLGPVTVTGAITATGDITAFQTSDQRLKTNIEVISNPIEKLIKLSGVTHSWNKLAKDAYGKDTTTRESGVIAQQVLEVLPEVVKQRDDGFYGVKYEGLIPLLIEAFKAQQELIDSLIREVEDLKSR